MLYRVRHIFWPDIKWQFCRSVHMIFKKKILEKNGLGVLRLRSCEFD